MIKLTFLIGIVSLTLAIAGCKNTSDQKKQVRQTAHKTKVVIKEKWHWGKAERQNEIAGYAQVVKAGRTIYISGIPTNDLSPKGIAEVYKTLEKCLNAFGASPEDVVKETLYTTNIEAMKKYNSARKAFYKGDFPAATWVQVSRLYEPDAKLEVELIAQLKGIDE